MKTGMPNLQGPHLAFSDQVHSRFVHDPKYNDDILPLWLREEFCKDPDIVKHSLSVGDSHRATKEVGDCKHAGVIISCTQLASLHYTCPWNIYPPFCDPGTVWRSILTRKPYFLHHCKAWRIYLKHDKLRFTAKVRVTHFQEVLARKGSLFQTSIAQ